MMELLNNIWNVLITPNEMNTKLIIIPFTFIETFVILSFSLTILNISTSKKNKFLYVFITSLLGIISNNLIPSPFCVFFNYITFFILMLIIFKVSPFKALIAVVSSISIFALIGCLILNPYITLLNITTEQLDYIPIFKVIYLILMYLLSFIIILILKIKRRWKNLF